jgi:CRISPR-associated protein (TIGR02584 family)
METYTLIIGIGQSPQVLTETVYSLARRNPPMRPRSVEVVSTRTGEAYVRALLFGEKQFDPARGEYIGPAEDRWSVFCREVFDCEPIPINFHQPTSPYLDDIRVVADDHAFANVCYNVVSRFTAPGMPPVVGSIAGGRKTMSAHLMTAFSVFARPEDHLTHILVDPVEYEHNRGFFWPRAEHAGKVRLSRVDIEFPRLSRILNTSFLADMPQQTRDLRAILEKLEPLVVREKVPDEAVFEKTGRGATLRLFAGGETLGTVTLTTSVAANFIVLAQRLNRGGVVAETLWADGGKRESEKHAIHAERLWYLDMWGITEVTAWDSNEAVSNAFYQIRKKIASSPIAERFFFQTTRRVDEGLLYTWAEPLPCVLRFAGHERLEVLNGDGLTPCSVSVLAT